jgi:heme/copper-type cytochrome/quinol oxidase subunit 2
MRVLVVLVAVVMSAAAVWALAFFAHRGEATSVSAAPLPPQHLTLTVLNAGDQMSGSELVLRPGRVVLTILNYASHTHTFSVPGLGVEQIVVLGSARHPSRTIVRFNARRGWFPWLCRFPCNMKGDLFVSPNPPRVHGAMWATAT